MTLPWEQGRQEMGAWQWACPLVALMVVVVVEAGKEEIVDRKQEMAS